MTHILIIHQAFASLDEPGGTRHFEFARMLAERGDRVTVIASPVSYITGSAGTPTEGDLPAGMTILRARVYSAHHRSFIHRTLAFLSFMWSAFWLGMRVGPVDLVWGTTPPIFQGVSALLIARFKRAKLLFEVRDLWPDFAIAAGVLTNHVLISASRWLEGFLYRSADCVMVNSPGFTAHVKARGARSVELVPNGADPAMFDPTAKGEAFRVAHSLEGKFVALYAGAHGMSNDLGVLLDAAEMVQGKGVQLVLVGDGKEKPALMQQAAVRRLGNVSFVSSVPKRGMAGTLAAADACIAILKPLDAYKTTYPNKVFDYMAAGRPVVLAIDGVIRELVETANCGSFVQPGDPSQMASALLKLAADPQSAHLMGTNGREYVLEHFSRAAIFGKLAQTIDHLLVGIA